MKRMNPLAGLCALSLVAAAGFGAVAQTPDPLLADRMRAHISFLADDALEGRDTGSRGFDIAALYVASQFQGLGLQPAGSDNSWYQPVQLARIALNDGAAIGWTGANGQTVRWEQGGEVILSAGRSAGAVALEAPVVFVGYGVQSPDLGLDDYAGLDVGGKIVVMLRGSPSSVPSDVAAHLGSSKGATAARNGAVGVIQVSTLADERTVSWQRRKGFMRSSSMTWADSEGHPFDNAPGIRASAAISHEAAAALFAGAPEDFQTILNAVEADKALSPRGFALNGVATLEAVTTVDLIESANVVGLLPGTDPSVADQPVWVTAHLDHVGLVTDPEAKDKVFNGAMDNASGVATLIEAARALSLAPPRRPVLFVALTAEEKGLLGAAYMAAHPLTPIENVAGLVNLDMPLLTYDFQDVVAYGAEHSTLQPLVAAAAAVEGLSLSPDPMPEQGLFTRSDHYEFVKKGVPSVFLATGFAGPGEAAWAEFFANHYHQPSDDLNLPIDWDAAARFARVNAAIIRAIGDAETRPLWREDSVFGRTFAPNSPKAPAVSPAS